MTSHVFVDTDVILDFLGDRKPFSKSALRLFILAEQKQIILHTSSNSITTAYYLLCKATTDAQARELVSGLMDIVHIIPVTHKILIQALKADFKDFEDAVQHFSALTIDEIKLIVTRNLKDYSKSKIPVSGPEMIFNI
ncbi:MAG: PIN domain-containing protein [Bacteroidota bacterium]